MCVVTVLGCELIGLWVRGDIVQTVNTVVLIPWQNLWLFGHFSENMNDSTKTFHSELVVGWSHLLSNNCGRKWMNELCLLFFKRPLTGQSGRKWMDGHKLPKWPWSKVYILGWNIHWHTWWVHPTTNYEWKKGFCLIHILWKIHKKWVYYVHKYRVCKLVRITVYERMKKKSQTGCFKKRRFIVKSQPERDKAVEHELSP